MSSVIAAHDASKTSPELQVQLNRIFDVVSNQENLLPIKVTKFFERKVQQEVEALGHTEGPLHRIVYPTKERMNVRAPGEVPDFVEDRSNMPEGVPGIMIRKYQNRMLFLPTSNCAAHCQYCFRQDVLSEEHGSESAELTAKLELLKNYLKDKPEVKEVILSGGDPMTLSLSALRRIVTTLKNELQIESIRIHTKTISYSPQVFKSEEKLQLLAAANVRMVFHLVHPYEICDEVLRTIRRIRAHGIRCYNQFPILRKINDHPDVLIRHLKTLDELGVRNLSVFIPDPINYSAAFRINLQRLFNIINEFNWKSPSWINSTRFLLDTQIGKVRREDIKHYDPAKGLAIFEREGRQIEYPDLPQELDIPGDLETMLWKDHARVR